MSTYAESENIFWLAVLGAAAVVVAAGAAGGAAAIGKCKQIHENFLHFFGSFVRLFVCPFILFSLVESILFSLHFLHGIQKQFNLRLNVILKKTAIFDYIVCFVRRLNCYSIGALYFFSHLLIPLSLSSFFAYLFFFFPLELVLATNNIHIKY